MQSFEAKGLLKIAAAQRPEHKKYWQNILYEPIEKALFYPDGFKAEDNIKNTYKIEFDRDIKQGLDKLSKGDHATRQVIMVAILYKLLNIYTGNDSIVIGQPLTTEQTTLSNYLVLRINVDEDLTFKQLLNSVRDSMISGLKFCDYPVSLIADELELNELDGNPFFDVAIEALESSKDPISEQFQCRVLISHFVDSESGGLIFSYDKGLFNEETIKFISEYYLSLLNLFLSDLDRKISDTSIMNNYNYMFLKNINKTEREYRDKVKIDEVFSEQVLKTPNKIALISGKTKITYRELNYNVEFLAKSLRNEGVKEDQLVAVVAERSLQMMVAILAILRAGGAYLPIDPSYPINRIKYMLDNSNTKLVLTHRGLLKFDLSSYKVLNIDSVPTEDFFPIDNSFFGNSNNLAYMIYTSGSTGKPKGVLIEHHSVINRISWMQNAYPISEDDIILQKTPTSFDVSVWELFWWFFVGASVCMLEPGGEKEPEIIVEAIESNNITTMHFVPSMLNVFLDYIEATNSISRLKSLRKVFTSGEALSLSQTERFKKLLYSSNKTRLINLYGPTEATVDVTHLDCTSSLNLARVTIGKPIDNTKIHIVNKNFQELPIGVPGELCISGVNLARGYHQLPEMTAERFIYNPDNLSERWYRTGDLARWLDNGEIEYLGRIDNQVKIRGFRIELLEIDEVLRGYDAIKDAVTIVHNIAGQDKLISYVTSNTKIDIKMLKEFVANHLPEYMVPDQIILLDDMPLSPNGKLDRKALPTPSNFQVLSEYVEPRNQEEKILINIWSEVLQQSRIGIYDNFFALGGNSIHFVTVLAKAKKHGLEFTFQQLFSHPTVAGLVEVMKHTKEELQKHEFVPFELLTLNDYKRLPPDIEDAYPLTMLQAGLIFQNELTFGTAQYHDIISYIVESPIDLDIFKKAVSILVERNPIFRTSYHLEEFDEYIQIVHKTAELPLYCNDLRALTQEEQEIWYQNWVNEEKSFRFKWSCPGLVRIHVHVLSNNLYRYVLSQHNSALDGWSITLVHTELFRIYDSLIKNTSFDEPKIENHIRNYVGLEIQALQSQKDRLFWQSMIDGAPYTNLPKRDVLQPVSELSVKFHEVDISKSLSNKIILLADSLNVPVKTVLMAAHLKFLSFISGNSDVITGYEHSGRPELEDATKAIGLFLNTVPFRMDINQPSWRKLIEKVYQTEAEMLPFRRYPMAQMKQDINTQEMLFDCAFNYTHFYLLKELNENSMFNLLDIRANSETEFALRAEFCRHFFTDDVKLSIHYHEHSFSQEQITNFSYYYIKIFELMTKNPDDNPNTKTFLTTQEQNHFSMQCTKIPDELIEILSCDESDTGICLLDKNLQPTPTGTIGDIYFINSNARKIINDSDFSLNKQELRAANRKGRWNFLGKLELTDIDKNTFFIQSNIQMDKKDFSINHNDNAPFDEMEDHIASVWSKVLKIPKESISRFDNFFDLGGNSLTAMKVVVMLKGKISLIDFMRNSTFSNLSEVAKNNINHIKSEILFEATNNRLNINDAIVCIPYAGGNAINFKFFAESIARINPNIRVYTAELPGHNLADNSDTLLSVEIVAEKIVSEIEDKITGKVFLWGHCVGSAIAIEVGRLLREKGKYVTVFVAGKLLPSSDKSRKLADDLGNKSDNEIKDWLFTQAGYGELKQLPEHDIAKLINIFRHDGCSANYFLAQLTERGKFLNFPIVMVAAKDDPFTPNYIDEYLNWRKICDSVNLIEINSGGHYFCRTNPSETALAIDKVIQSYL